MNKQELKETIEAKEYINNLVSEREAIIKGEIVEATKLVIDNVKAPIETGSIYF